MGGQKGIAIFCKYLGIQNELTTVSVNDNDIKAAETYSMLPVFTEKRTRYLNILYVLKIKKIIKERSIKNIIIEHPYMAWMGWYLRKRPV